jgi:hypothetical protein
VSITVPAAGDGITAAWGIAVAAQLNAMIPLMVTTDFTTTSTSPVTITGLSFPAVAGTVYNISLRGTYSVGGASTGIGLSWHLSGGATGTVRVRTEILSSSVTDATADTGWPLSDATEDGATSTTDSTAVHLWTLEGWYQCTVSGTFAIQLERNGTSTTCTINKGSGGMVLAA